MKILLEYIKAHIRIILLFLLFCLIFSGTFLLFGIPAVSVGYAAAVCGIILLIYSAVDFFRFRKRHIVLKHLAEEITCTAENLPEPATLTEEDLQELIKILLSEKQRLETEMSRKYTDRTDYFTLWVHQIKTPISSMRLALEGDDTVRGRQLSGDLQRIEQYVEMALCFMRLENVSDFVIKRCSLDNVVKQAVKKFSMEFIGRKIRLVYEPLNTTVLTDEKWLLFVVEQVISNALKYTQSGSISIYTEEPQTLCVRDTGIGIAPEDLPRIFDKGYTGCNGRADKKASGIGLYLCRRICNMLGHKISAESGIGAGTVIRIDLSEYKTEIE